MVFQSLPFEVHGINNPIFILYLRISFYIYMAKRKSIASGPSVKEYATIGFGAVLGSLGAIAAVGLICVTLFGIGYYLITKYNKPGTKLFSDIQPMQYVGIALCALACLPFIQYFFLGFLASAGESVFNSMFE
jgi:hypothetical protein